MNKRYDDTVQIHLKEPIKDNVQKVKPLNTLSKVDKLINALKLSDKFDPFTMDKYLTQYNQIQKINNTVDAISFSGKDIKRSEAPDITILKGYDYLFADKFPDQSKCVMEGEEDILQEQEQKGDKLNDILKTQLSVYSDIDVSYIRVQSKACKDKMLQLWENQYNVYQNKLSNESKEQLSIYRKLLYNSSEHLAIIVDVDKNSIVNIVDYLAQRLIFTTVGSVINELRQKCIQKNMQLSYVEFLNLIEVGEILKLPKNLKVANYLCVVPEDYKEKVYEIKPKIYYDSYVDSNLYPYSDKILKTTNLIAPLNNSIMEKTFNKLNTRIKPTKGLGKLESLVVQLSGICGNTDININKPAVVLFAGDHGVYQNKITTHDQTLTKSLMDNIIKQRCYINSFADSIKADVFAIDVGMKYDVADNDNKLFIDKKICNGTNNFLSGKAIERKDVVLAIETGIEIAKDIHNKGYNCFILGEIGIGNSIVSSAIISAITGLKAEAVVDYSKSNNETDEEVYRNKISAITKGLQLHKYNNAIEILESFGGYEHAATCGLILGAAMLRIPIILDGITSSAAALLSNSFSTSCRSFMIAGHCSTEKGNRAALKTLKLEPILDLQMKLGEGTGATLAYSVLSTIVKSMDDVASIDDILSPSDDAKSASTNDTVVS